MRPTEQLKEEHKVIERALSALDEFATALEEGRDVAAASLEKAVNFFGGFADKVHHAKEEAHLFPLLEQSGIPKENGPIGLMLLEHEQGRGLLRGLREAVKRYAAGERGAAPDIVTNARGYIEVLHHHILKEDHVLFKMADEALGQQDQMALESCFRRVEEEEIGEEALDRYRRMASELEDEAGRL